MFQLGPWGFERADPLFVIVDRLAQVPVLEQRVPEITHDTGERHDLGAEPDFGFDLALSELLEALVGLLEALVGLVDAPVGLVDAGGKLGPRGADSSRISMRISVVRSAMSGNRSSRAPIASV